jgi:hypothetical protein
MNIIKVCYFCHFLISVPPKRLSFLNFGISPKDIIFGIAGFKKVAASGSATFFSWRGISIIAGF